MTVEGESGLRRAETRNFARRFGLGPAARRHRHRRATGISAVWPVERARIVPRWERGLVDAPSSCWAMEQLAPARFSWCHRVQRLKSDWHLCTRRASCWFA